MGFYYYYYFFFFLSGIAFTLVRGLVVCVLWWMAYYLAAALLTFPYIYRIYHQARSNVVAVTSIYSFNRGFCLLFLFFTSEQYFLYRSNNFLIGVGETIPIIFLFKSNLASILVSMIRCILLAFARRIS